MRVLWRVLVKELLQLRRDKRMIPAMIVGPLVQLFALGFAANSDVDRIPLVLVDQDRTRSSRELVERLTGSRYFELQGAVDEVDEAEPWLVDGRAQVVLVVGPGYGRELAAGSEPQVQLLVDGTDSSSAVVGLGYAASIVRELAGERVRLELLERSRRALRDGRAAPAVGRIELVPRVWYNPDLKSRWYFVPAILALTLMLLTMILPSMAVVREKEIGTLEQLIVTPIRAWQLILGKLLPFAMVGVLDLALVTLIALTVFGVPLRGSFGTLLLLTLPFLATMLGLGLLASTLVRTQQQAMMTSLFLMMVPMIYLSGLIFPIENMPRPIQLGTYAIPLRYYAVIVRGVFLKGSGLAVLWPQGLILCGFAVAAIGAAGLRFRKSLD